MIAQGCVMMPGVPNAAMARQVQRVGFDAVYASGAGMANTTAGVADIGLLGMAEVVRLAEDRGVFPSRWAQVAEMALEHESVCAALRADPPPLSTEHIIATGQRPVAVCGVHLLSAALCAPPQRWCPRCLRSELPAQRQADRRRGARHARPTVWQRLRDWGRGPRFEFRYWRRAARATSPCSKLPRRAC